MKQKFREITEEEFAKFTASCPCKNYMQSLPMYKRYQKYGRESYLVGAFSGEELVVVGLLSKIFEKGRFKIFTMSRGPIMDYSNNIKMLDFFLASAKDFARQKGASVLQITPNLLESSAPKDFSEKLKMLGFKKLGEYEQVKWIYALNFDHIDGLPVVKKPKRRSDIFGFKLDQAAEQTLFRSFRKGHRYLIKYATERYGLKLRVIDPAEYDVMCNLFQQAGELHGFTPRDVKFYRELTEFFGDDAVGVIAELPDGTPVAAGFFLLYGDEIIYLSSGLSRAHKQLGGPHLIQWQMIRFAYANGYRKYNFWGTNPSANNGVFNFKQGFHGEVDSFVGAYAAPLTLIGKLYVARIRFAEHREIG